MTSDWRPGRDLNPCYRRESSTGNQEQARAFYSGRERSDEKRASFQPHAALSTGEQKGTFRPFLTVRGARHGAWILALSLASLAGCSTIPPAPGDMNQPDLAPAADLARGAVDLAPGYGTPCTVNAECPSPLACGTAYGFGAPWGYCTTFCGTSSPDAAGCPSGYACQRTVDAETDAGDFSTFACLRN